MGERPWLAAADDFAIPPGPIAPSIGRSRSVLYQTWTQETRALDRAGASLMIPLASGCRWLRASASRFADSLPATLALVIAP